MAFQQTVRVGGVRVGEIDIETAGAIVETTVATNSKAGQVAKLVSSRALNPCKKQVIVYGPNLTKGAAAAVEKAGAKVAKTMLQLREQLTRIASQGK